MASPWVFRAWSVACLLPAAAGLRAQAPPPSSPAPSVASGRREYPAILMGRVTTAAGAVLAGAEITLAKSDKLHTITGDSGQFNITGLPPGTNVFNVRRLGYEPASFTAVLKSGKT